MHLPQKRVSRHSQTWQPVVQVQFPQAALQLKAASSSEAAAWVKDVRGAYKGEAGVSLPEQSQSPVVSQSVRDAQVKSGTAADGTPRACSARHVGHV